MSAVQQWSDTTPISDQELDELFTPVYGRIAAGALQREIDRLLPFEQIQWLRESGFGRLRVPREYGGFGVSLPQFFRQLVALAAADSNLPQALRGHIGFLETRLVHPVAANRERWLTRIGSGDLVGNAQSERGSSSFWTPSTRVTRHGDGWRLSGEKYYTTGSLYADWIQVSAGFDTRNHADVLVRADAPGIVRVDDWDGFGQRLTGSGTTTFTEVDVDADHVELYPPGLVQGSYLGAVFQLIHLACLAGVGRAALNEVAAFVRAKKRNLFNPAFPSPGLDPHVQSIVGKLAGASFVVDSAVEAAGAVIEETYQAQVRGEVTAEHFDRSDIAVYAIQGQVVELVLDLTARLFEVGGASAVSERLQLDRHWRNARTIASHNPVVYRNQMVGDHVLNGTSPHEFIAQHLTAPGGSPSTSTES
ncbi:hypothetical protein [Nocardioides sp. W7]|uniref:hypothetical protein n=1 Tax=Nocardioides sp. W7 TaxID=2931390 RepID=UPI001FCFC374|nr:hypothetical protein [Nocardioides sp. W7]